jgi:hypothetical protein
MKLTLRDLFWLMLVVAMICAAWIRDRSQQQQLQAQAEQHKQRIAKLRQEWASNTTKLTDQIRKLASENHQLKNQEE